MIRRASVTFPVTNGVMNGISHVGVTRLLTEACGPAPGAGPSEVTVIGKGTSGDQLQNQMQ